MTTISLKKGLLIVIEGIDGAGKSTQAKRLVAFLRESGYDTLYLTEPTSGPHGKRIRERARGGEREASPAEEYRLFVLDREENVTKNIIPALNEKRVIVLDRYYFSTMAYQGALGLDPEKIRRENEAFAPVPDRVIILTVPVSVGLSRIEATRGGFTAFEGEEYLERVKEIFEGQVAKLPFAKLIDGTKTSDEVFEKIKEEALDVIKPLTPSEQS
jgi:dTMP kinase